MARSSPGSWFQRERWASARASRRAKPWETTWRYTLDLIGDRQDRQDKEWVASHVDQLKQNGFDEGSGHLFDRIIEARREKWDAAAQYDEHEELAQLSREGDAAKEQVRRKQVRCDNAERDRAEAVATLENAISRLSGKRVFRQRTRQSTTVRDAVGAKAVAAAAGERAATLSFADPPSPNGTSPVSHAANERDHSAPTSASGPSMVAGRPLAARLHLAILVLAAGADIIAFLQVLELLNRLLSGWQVALIVFAFAGLALYLAHVAGATLRETQDDGRTPARSALIALCVISWALLGAIAFYVRVHLGGAHPNTGSASINGSGPTAGGDQATASLTALANALVFGSLYLATGVAAGAGAFLTHDPALSQYLHARRNHRRAVSRAEQRQGELAAAQARVERNRAERERATQRRAALTQAHAAHATELAELARRLMAAHLQDPAASDGLFFASSHARPDREDS